MSAVLEDVVTNELETLGYTLVELRKGGTRARPVLDVRIERKDESPVTVDDCTRASRALEARFDEDGLVGERYELQVSSPGIERPLYRAGDWRRFTGYRANVLSPALGGRVAVEILGLEGEPGAEVAVVRTERGEERRVPLGEVREARLAFYTKR